MIDTLKTVLWGAIGVRRRSSHEQAKINPVHVVVMAIVCVVLFVFALRTIVRIVVS